MSEKKLTPSILYTTEAEESKKKTDEELNIPDPERTVADSIIAENIKEEEEKEFEDTAGND